jgi:CRP-like cAMP-binding protein
MDGLGHLEVGLVGSEGAVGIPFALGMSALSVQTVAQGSGSALCMEATIFTREMEQSKQLAWMMGRYGFFRFRQLSRLAGCMRFHVIEARLARRLLMTQDRMKSPGFHLTHELLGSMLGVRRVGITSAASALAKLGLIHYSRGNIRVLDRRGLKRITCSCYEADRETYSSAFRNPAT